MALYPLLQDLHLISALLLLGGGLLVFGAGLLGLYLSTPQRQQGLYRALLWVDWLVIASNALLIALSGLALIKLGGWPLNHFWLLLSAGLYALAGLCWLPILWLHSHLRHLAKTASVKSKKPYLQATLALSSLAIALLLSIAWLMTSKPL